MKSAVGFGSKEEESEEDSDSEISSNVNTEDDLSYSINGETVLQVNDEVRKQAFETVGFDPNEEEVEYHPSFVLLNLNVLISTFGIRLCEKEQTLLKLDLRSNKFLIDYRQGAKNDDNKLVPNIFMKSNINDIQVIDCMNPNKTYSTVLAKQQTNKDLLEASVDIEPLNDMANSIVTVTLMPQEIIVTKGMIDRVQSFFAAEGSHDLENLKQVASNAVAESAQARKQRIEEMIASRYIMKLKVQLNAPLIKIPSAAPVERMLVLDLGQFIIGSAHENAVANSKEAIVDDPNQENCVDLKQDKKYDHMILQARNITATIVENPESVENAYKISIFETRNTLVAKMKFCLPADVCETDQLTQADIKVNVPQLHLVMSEETLKKF